MTQWCYTVMPAVHSRRVHLASFLSKSYMRRGCASVIVHSCRKLSIHLGMQIEKKTIKNQKWQPGETWDPLTRTLRTAKKRELTRQDTSTRSYTRASEARQMFPSTFSLSHCIGLSQRECTASTTVIIYTTILVPDGVILWSYVECQYRPLAPFKIDCVRRFLTCMVLIVFWVKSEYRALFCKKTIWGKYSVSSSLRDVVGIGGFNISAVCKNLCTESWIEHRFRCTREMKKCSYIYILPNFVTTTHTAQKSFSTLYFRTEFPVIPNL